MSEETTTETTLMSNEKEKKGAKDYSLLGMIFAALYIVGWSSYIFVTGKNIDIDNVLKAAGGIVLCFSPVTISLIMDKVKNIKFGGEK